jgi:hypothetical protein
MASPPAGFSDAPGALASPCHQACGTPRQCVEAADAEADLDTYRREIVVARAAVASRGLDDVVPHPLGRDIPWIYLHMIEEYARHNGHADLIRECIDGVTAYAWRQTQARSSALCR